QSQIIQDKGCLPDARQQLLPFRLLPARALQCLRLLFRREKRLVQFPENGSLPHCLLIAKKRSPGLNRDGGNGQCLSLHNKTPFDRSAETHVRISVNIVSVKRSFLDEANPASRSSIFSFTEIPST